MTYREYSINSKYCQSLKRRTGAVSVSTSFIRSESKQKRVEKQLGLDQHADSTATVPPYPVTMMGLPRCSGASVGKKSVEASVCRVSPRPPSVHAEQGHLYLVRQARLEDEADSEAT